MAFKEQPGWTYVQPVRDPYQYYAAMQAQQQQQNQPQQQPKTRGRGGFLSSLISELGGGSGAATGAAIGSAVGPVGTVLGAALGGFLGGTAGKGVEQKVRDNQNFLGAGGSAKSAFGEGALAGALSGLGEGYQVMKGAKAAKALSGVAGAEDTVKGMVKPGLLETKGLGLTSRVGGYGVGSAVPGSPPLTPSQVKEFDTLLRRLKIPANDATDLARNIEQRLQGTHELLTKSMSKGNAAIPRGDIKSFTNGIISQVQETGGLGKTANKFVQEEANKISKIKDVRGLLEYRKQLDSVINFNANPTAAMADKQGAARIIRENLKEKINGLVPGMKEQNNLYHTLSDLQSHVLRAANRGNSQATGGGGLFGRVLSSPTANTAKAKVGAAAQKVGGYTAGTGGGLSPLTRQLKLQAPANLTHALINTAQTIQNPQDTQMQGGMDQMGGGQMPTPTSFYDNASGALQGLESPVKQSPYSQEAAMADIKRDPKNASTYLTLYKTFNPDNGAPKPLSTTAKQQNALVSTGYNAIQNLKDMIQKDPSLIAKTGVPGRNVLGIGNRMLGLGQYEAMAQQAIDSVARLRTGAAMTPSEETFYRRMVPQAGDSPGTVQQKLNELERYFASFQNTQSDTSATPDLQSALMQAGGY